MPIDPSIALGVQPPNGMQTLSSLLGIKTAMQQQQAMQIANEANQANLGERTALRNLVTDPNVLDASGNVDPQKYAQRAPMVAPTLGAPNSQAITNSLVANLQNAHLAFSLRGEQADRAFQEAGALYSDPRIMRLADQPSPGQLTDAATAVAEAQDRMILAGVPREIALTQTAPILTALQHNPQVVPQMLQNILKAGASRQQQPGIMAPSGTQVATDRGTQFVNTNPYAPGGMGNMGGPYAPPNQAIATTGGGTAIGNPATGRAWGFNTSNGPAVDFPPGETHETQADLQAQRSAAQTAANQAPTAHNLNREVIAQADNGFATGKLGELTQKVAGAFGYQMSSDAATNYNVLGKMLERSALTAAQSMGPHTNAGLEAQVRANGSLDYTPQAIRKIAALNDALTSGSTLYQSGLESAIGNSPNGVFAKRQFDQQWSSAMNPAKGSGDVDGVLALRWKNAIDAKDATEQAAILKQVGGAGSSGARALSAKLHQLLNLAGQ